MQRREYDISTSWCCKKTRCVLFLNAMWLTHLLSYLLFAIKQYIDATKRGGIGRFLNHSCAPNCYVAKWTVGSHYRMGIFASRNVQKDEELTFNYNVDRYGYVVGSPDCRLSSVWLVSPACSHEAQPCYCGEPKCVGFIGGKTQTDIGAMDDLYLDGKIIFTPVRLYVRCMANTARSFIALGITDEVERLGLKGSKKKKGKKLDEDYMVRTSNHLDSMSSFPRNLHSIYSLTSSQSWRRTYPRSFRQWDKHKAARFCTSCWSVSR